MPPFRRFGRHHSRHLHVTSIAQAQGTTGYFINEVPMTDPFYSAGNPRHRYIRRQQCTLLSAGRRALFGSASLGGAVNYQAAAPRLSIRLASTSRRR